MGDTKKSYQIASQSPVWIKADVELAQYWADIPPVPIQYIMCLKFCTIPVTPYMKNNLKPLAVILLIQRPIERTVAEKRSWYHHNSVAAPLLEKRVPQRVQLPLRNGVTLDSVELDQLRHSECKLHAPIPLISEIPAAPPLKPKKKKTLKKLADVIPPLPLATIASPTALYSSILSATTTTFASLAVLSPYLYTNR